MTKVLTYALTIAMCMGSTALLAIGNRSETITTNSESRFASDGAFRDGVFLGKRAVERGEPAHPAIGRWSTNQDRAMFLAGYRLGYRQSLNLSHRGKAQPSHSSNQRSSERRA
jgi:hypothetical protein